MKVLLVYPNLMLVSTLPNNIALLSACLKEEGHEVKLFDATLYRTAEKSNDEMRVERMQVRNFDLKSQGVTLRERNIYDDFIMIVNDFHPDLIAVSVVDDTVKMGVDLIEKAECKRRGVPVIFGGVHVLFNAENLIKNDNIDMLCIGEGELTLQVLCKCLDGNSSLESVPNLWYKDKQGGIKRNAMGDVVDINNLPFEDFSIFEEQRFYRPMQGRIIKMLPINFERGCPYQCTFCDAPAINNLYRDNKSKYYRRKTIERIYSEMKYQLEYYNVEYFYFNSETFLSMSIGDLKEFASMYSELKLPFWCQTRVETISEDKVKYLKEMNCDRISIGIEHGNEKFRKDILKKRFSNDDLLKAFDVLHKYEMKVSVNNIIGFPDEDRGLIFDTIKLNRLIKADSVNGFIFQPYTGTALREYCLSKGYIDVDTVTDTPIGEPVLNMPQITNDEIEGLLRTFVLYVKMPEEYYPKIKVAEKLNEEGDKALEELKVIFYENYFRK